MVGTWIPYSASFYTFRTMRLVFLTLALALCACGDWKQDPAELTARGQRAEGFGCAACHSYPPQDSNHLYHLYVAVGNKYANGPVTCVDCHRASLQFREVVLLDTLFLDPDADPSFHITQSGVDWPVRTAEDTFAIRIRTWKVDTIRELRQNRPLDQAGNPALADTLVGFMTSLAHLNGSVDVLFDPKYSEPDRFGGDSAAFHPREETCSAVSCHPTDGPYRFAAPAKGLPGLK